jgi:plastocyanin
MTQIKVKVEVEVKVKMLSVAILLIAHLACNTKNDEPLVVTPPQGHVFMVSFAFQPESLRIAAGDTVAWVNKSSTDQTATSGRDGAPDGRWDSGLLPPGDSFRRIFLTAGAYDYFCTPHWNAGMQGVIFVAAGPQKAYVKLHDYAFVPESLYIRTGDTVVWINEGSEIHTTTSGVDGTPDGRWTSDPLSPGDSFVREFPDTGSFAYYCRFHYMLGMHGWIFVQPRQ